MARVATTYLMTGDFTERLNALYARAAEMSKVEAGPSASLADVGQGEDLWREYEALSAEVQDLKSGKGAIEERARSELGLIKPGEVFYQVVDPTSANPKTDNGNH